MASESLAPDCSQADGPMPCPGILEVAPYKPGAAKGTGSGPLIKINQNEGALGPSPMAIEALTAAGRSLDRYPDGGAQALRATLADCHGLNPDRIVCGNGSDELLALLAQTYLQPGDEAVIPAHTFGVYEIVTRVNGGVPVIVPDPDLRISVDAILDHVGPRTKLVYLANPNSPTGTCLDGAELARLQAGLSPQTLLILDGAYAEYVTRTDYDPGIRLVERCANVVMTRTFSKIHALAALRVGWAYCPPGVADALSRVRAPFNVNALAQAAAIASLNDRDHMAAGIAHNGTWRAWLAGELTRLGLEPVPSEANFILTRFPSPEAAAAAHGALLQNGILVRPTTSFGLPDCLRISVGLQNELEKTVQVLEAHLKS